MAKRFLTTSDIGIVGDGIAVANAGLNIPYGQALGFENDDNDAALSLIVPSGEHGNQTIEFPWESGTVALLSDLAANGTPAATASGTNTYAAIINPAITAYVAMSQFIILFSNANTGPSTLNLNSLGAKNIFKNVNVPLIAGDISAGQAFLLFYDGTNFQIIGDTEALPTVSSGEDVLTVTPAGVQANYSVVQQIVSASSLSSADFSTGIAAVTGIQGQIAFDTNYQYLCIGTNQWTRQAINNNLINLYLGTVNDSGGDYTSSSLQSAYPSSLVGQQIIGINKLYTKVTSTGWIKTAIAAA